MRRLYKAAGNAAFFSVQVAPCAHVISAPTRMFGYDFFCRQLLNKEGPASEVDTAVLKDEQLAWPAAYPVWAHSHTAWKPALEKLQAGGHRARRCAPSLQNFMMFHRLRIRYSHCGARMRGRRFCCGTAAGGGVPQPVPGQPHALCGHNTSRAKRERPGSVGHGCAAHSSLGDAERFRQDPARIRRGNGAV